MNTGLNLSFNTRRLRVLPTEIKGDHHAEWNKFEVEMRYLVFKILKY